MWHSPLKCKENLPENLWHLMAKYAKFQQHVKRKLKRNFDNLYLEQGIKASITTPSTFVGFSPGQPEHRYFAFETAYSYPLWPQKKAVTQH